MKMEPPLHRVTAFSLVEVTLALGVAAFCLLLLLGLLPTGLKTQQSSIQQTTANAIISTIWSDLRADMILPPGQYRHLEEDSGVPVARPLGGNAAARHSLFHTGREADWHYKQRDCPTRRGL